jgi:hypothetical protein
MFDLLIGQEDRSAASYGYTQPQWDLQTSQHGDAFNTLHDLPGSVNQRIQGLPMNVWVALRELDEKNIMKVAGQYLSKAQITALLARRDAILAIMGNPAASYDPPEMAARDGRHP